MKKNHDRAPHKKGFSIALPKKLLEDIETIAREETRSRNGQIEHFLTDAVKRHEAAHQQAKVEPLSLVAEEHLKPSSPGKSSLSTPAPIAPTRYPTGKRRKKEG